MGLDENDPFSPFWTHRRIRRYPASGEAARGSSWDTPLPHSWGFGVYADAGEAGEGVFLQGQNKTYPPPSKPHVTFPCSQCGGASVRVKPTIGDW